MRTNQEQLACTKKRQRHDGQRGSMMIFAAIALLGVIGFAALVIDSGYMLLTKSELQNAADSGAASGNFELTQIYKELGPYVNYTTYTLTTDDKARIHTAVNRATLQNDAAGDPVSIAPGDILFGVYDSTINANSYGDTGVTAVEVYAHRNDQSAGGSVSTLLASAIGVDNFNVSADAGAAMNPLKRLPAGYGEFPVGIARAWFEAKDSPCGDDSYIEFYPTNSTVGCAGWHTFQDYPANASTLMTILREIKAETWVSPEIVAGETDYSFTGGTVDSALMDAKRAYDYLKDENGEWTVHLPVYDYSTCDNPTGWIRIVGIATAIVKEMKVLGNPKRISGDVACEYVAFGEGGGPDYGTYASLSQYYDPSPSVTGGG